MVSLPWPPSVNRVWRSYRGRTVLASEVRTYRKAVWAEVLLQGIPRHMLNKRLEVSILANAPDERARDLDNLLKAPLDALKHCGVILDDSLIDLLRIERGEVSKRPRLTIQISERQ